MILIPFPVLSRRLSSKACYLGNNSVSIFILWLCFPAVTQWCYDRQHPSQSYSSPRRLVDHDSGLRNLTLAKVKECKTVSINTTLRITIFVKPFSPSSFPSTFISLTPARVLQSPLNLYFPSRPPRPHLHVRIPCSSTRPKSLIVL